MSFAPTPRQERFREVIIVLAEDDEERQERAAEQWLEAPFPKGPFPKIRRRWTMPEWYRASVEAGEPVTPAEYSSWEGEDGFVEWWCELLPAYSQRTQTEARYGDRRFFESVVDNVEEPGMARIYGAMAETHKGDGDGEISEALRALLHQATKPNPWLTVGVD